MAPLGMTNSGFESTDALVSGGAARQVSSAVFDYPTALNGVEGDEPFLKEISQMFLDLSPDLLAKVKNTVAKRDLPNALRAAHSLTGAVGNLASKTVTDAVHSLEEKVRAGNVASMDDAYALLAGEVQHLRQALSDFVAVPER